MIGSTRSIKVSSPNQHAWNIFVPFDDGGGSWIGGSNLQRRSMFPSFLPEVDFRTCQVFVPDCVVSSSDIQDTKNDESSHVSAYRKIDFNARYPKQATNRSLQTVNIAYREEKQACKAQKMDCQQRATTEDINHKSLSGQREKM